MNGAFFVAVANGELAAARRAALPHARFGWEWTSN